MWISASWPKPAHSAGEGDMGIETAFAKALRLLTAASQPRFASQAPATREFNMGVLQT